MCAVSGGWTELKLSLHCFHVGDLFDERFASGAPKGYLKANPEPKPKLKVLKLYNSILFIIILSLWGFLHQKDSQ